MTDRGFRRAIVILVLTESLAFGQSIAVPPAFEVANVKPSAPLDMAAMRAGTAHIGTRIDATRVDIGTASLLRLICTAYRLRPYQVAGPEWIKTAYFDIQAKIPDGGTVDQVPEMLQVLLRDRFGLNAHHDSKEQPVYALVLEAGGPKMKESAVEATAPPAADAPKPVEMSVPTEQGDVKMTRTAQGISLEMPGGEISGKIRASVVNAGPSGAPPTMHLESSGMSMKSFAAVLSTGVVTRPVVDLTGLKGNYEVVVDISADDAMNVARASLSFLAGVNGGVDGGIGGGAASDPAGSSIFKSLQKLGLRLEPRKLPLDLLVVDHIEKTPAEN